MNSILIVGGTGFLGFHTAKFFLNKKFKVFSLSRNKPKKIRRLKKVKYLYADISKKNMLLKKLSQLSKIDYVINFGGEVDHRKIKKTLITHYNGTKNLANYFIKTSIKKFIQIGSGLEYGSKKSVHKETLPLKPQSNYAKAKAKSSKFIIKLQKKNFPAVILRLYQVYGPYQDINRFIPQIITGCLDNKKFPCSNGSQYRDFIHVDDFVNYVYLLTISKSIIGETFNIGFGNPVKLKNIIKFIRKTIGKGKPDFGKIKLRKEEKMITYPNIQKLKKCTNKNPKIEIFDGLKKTIKFYNNHIL